MTTILRKQNRSKKNKYTLKLSLIIAIIFYIIFKAIFSDWEHFKAGITGNF